MKRKINIGANIHFCRMEIPKFAVVRDSRTHVASAYVTRKTQLTPARFRWPRLKLKAPRRNNPTKTRLSIEAAKDGKL